MGAREANISVAGLNHNFEDLLQMISLKIHKEYAVILFQGRAYNNARALCGLPTASLAFCFHTDSAEGCDCWSVPIRDFLFLRRTVGYPQCQRLAERICCGTCDCTNTQHGRIVWFTSLHLACYYGQVEIVKCLMQFCQTAAQFQERALLTPLMVSFIIIQLYTCMLH